jgi:hypothetical protein
MESKELDLVHSTLASDLLNSEVRHSLPGSLAICSGIVKDCFTWSCQKISFRKAILSAFVIHCGILPSLPTPWLVRILFNPARIFYIFLVRKRQFVVALQNRFDGLPFHSKMYYISYYPVGLEEIHNIIMSENAPSEIINFLVNSYQSLYPNHEFDWIDVRKMKMDGTDFRLQWCISCGAYHVVENVWPYLLPPAFVRSYVDAWL